MSPHCPPTASTVSAQETIDLELLHKAQAYLECRSRHLTPDGRLLEAWEQFYRSCDALIRSFALTCHVSEADLDDCVQQVWTELALKLRYLCYDAQRGRFHTWLYIVVRNKAVDLIRQRSRHPTVSLPFEAAAVLSGREPDPAAECERRGQQAAVWQVLAELDRQVSVRSYLVLYLRWLEGWTVEEVAACLSLTPAQVRLRAHRMKRRFRRLFELYTSKTEPPDD